MYKKVKSYAMQNGLTVDEKGGIAYGRMNGAFLTIRQDPQTPAKHTIQLWVKPKDTEPVPAIVDFLNQCTSKFQYLQTASYGNGKITAEFQGLGFQWGKKYVPCMEAFLKELTGYCSNNGLVLACGRCGEENGLNLYQIDGINHVFCSSCYSEVSDQIHRTMTEKAKGGAGNVVGGIVGALLGSLLGVLVWVLIYQLGYISAIAGAVMVICALKGYEMLGGKLSKTGIILSCLLSLVMVLVAEQVSLAIEIQKAFREYYDLSFFDAFRSVPQFMQEPEIRNSVISDLVFGYILMVVGAWGTVRQALKTSTGKQDVRMVTSLTPAGSTQNRDNMAL